MSTVFSMRPRVKSFLTVIVPCSTTDAWIGQINMRQVMITYFMKAVYNNFSVPVTLTGTSLRQHRDMAVIVTCHGAVPVMS